MVVDVVDVRTSAQEHLNNVDATLCLLAQQRARERVDCSTRGKRALTSIEPLESNHSTVF
jgi:hypothetical protein